MNKNQDLLEIFEFALVCEFEHNPAKSLYLVSKINDCLFIKNSSKNIRRDYYSKSVKKFTKIKSFLRQQFFYELENYEFSNFCSPITNETTRNLLLRFSLLWSMILACDFVDDKKYKVLDEISNLLNEENYEISFNYASWSQFFDRVFMIHKYSLDTGLDLECNKLAKYFNVVREIGKGGFGRVKEYRSVKDNVNYAIKSVKLKGEMIKYNYFSYILY
jgi:hypothetical protein